MLRFKVRHHATLLIGIGIIFMTDSVPAQPKPAASAPSAAEEKPEFPKFEEVMKDFNEVPTAEPPFFPLWYNKKTDCLRAQIPSSLVGQKFLIASSIAGGSFATGFQLDHFLAYLDRMDKQLVLMRVDPRYAEGGNEPVADVIKRSYGGDIIVRTIPILTLRNGDPVIDLDGLFKSDFSEIARWAEASVNPQLGKWAKYKAFPQNVELTVDLAFFRGGEGKRNLMHYSLSKIPESSQAYRPRRTDNRIGYFLTARKDWSKPHNAPTLFDRNITRWHLEKRDPAAELSAPKNPILWHIEKTVPLKYRRWVKEGILEWNKAFEKCGFLDAIEVKQQEDYDRETKDLDPEDVRYNFFRWIVTGTPFAMGPSRAHPITGQIFDADIVFDDAMVRRYVGTFSQLSGGEDAWQPYEPVVEQFFKSHPQWRYRSPLQRLLPGVKLREDPDRQLRSNLLRRMAERGQPLCDYAVGMAEHLDFAGVALQAKGLGRDNEDFIGQIIKEIVMHEVGHCLGLRHNFKGSTWLPMKEVESHCNAGEANVGSVMDYNPAIVAPRGEEQGSFTTRSIGPYDYWAIEYGYRPTGAPHKSEEEMLSQIGRRVAEAGLDYGTDEDTISFFSPDPLSNRYDMGRDVRAYAERQLRLIESLVKDISDWAVKDGESYTKLRRSFMRLVTQRALVCDYVGRFVGGQIIRRDQKGDAEGRAPIEVVDATKQRESLQFVCEKIFAEDAYRFDPQLLAKFSPGRYWHWDSDEFDFLEEFNVHEVVAEGQFRCLLTLMNPFAINRIHDNQLKFDENAEIYTLAEHLHGMTDAIWSELRDSERRGTDREPYVNSFRRNLQRQHLEMLMNLVLTDPDGTVPADANSLARQCVAGISKRAGMVLDQDRLDLTSRAHLDDVKKRIDKALEAEYSIGGWRTLSQMPFFFRSVPSMEVRPEMAVLPGP